MLEFISENQDALADYLNDSFKPLYNFDFAIKEHNLKSFLNAVRVNGKYPLFTAQKHVVAAVARGFEERNAVLLVGQMGTGKTSITSTSIITLTGNISSHLQSQMKPNQVSLIVSPPHLIEKWERELLSMYPDSLVQVCNHHEEVKRFLDMIDIASRKLSPWFVHFALRSKQQGNLVKKLIELQLIIQAIALTPKIMLMKRDMTKLGSSFSEAVIWRKRAVALWRHDQETPDGYEPHQRIAKIQEPHCPSCHTTIYEKIQDGNLVIATKDWLSRGKRQCPVCKEPLWQSSRLKWEQPKNGEKYPPCNPRFRLDEYIQRKYRDRIFLLVWDEVHEAQRADRGNGSAFGRLANSAQKVLGLTGTPFNGYSSSTFNLEYQINPRVRKKYPWGGSERREKKVRGSREHLISFLPDYGSQRGNSEARWVNDMGVREKRVDTYPVYDKENGTYTGTTTYDRPYVEATGINPQLVAEMLDHTIFLSLQDLGANLPSYEEFAIPIEMDSDVANTYDQTNTKLKDYLRERYWEGDSTFRGAYLQWSLGWPNRPYQETKILHNRKNRLDRRRIDTTVIATLKAFDTNRIYAKEQELLNLLREELQEKRPCVIYVRQSDTNDIRPRLEKLIRQHIPEAKPFVLQASVNPIKRESLINKEIAKGINVLITNPTLVATGLDLIHFKTLIWYEPIYDLRLLSQASSRTLRANSDPNIPLKTFYMFYEGTMEHTAAALMSRKQRAAKLLTGEVGLTGLDSLTEDEGSFEEALVSTMLNGSQQLSDPRELFRKEALNDNITQADLAFWNTEDEESNQQEFILLSPWDSIREYIKQSHKPQFQLFSAEFHQKSLEIPNASLSTKTDRPIQPSLKTASKPEVKTPRQKQVPATKPAASLVGFNRLTASSIEIQEQAIFKNPSSNTKSTAKETNSDLRQRFSSEAKTSKPIPVLSRPSLNTSSIQNLLDRLHNSAHTIPSTMVFAKSPVSESSPRNISQTWQMIIQSCLERLDPNTKISNKTIFVSSTIVPISSVFKHQVDFTLAALLDAGIKHSELSKHAAKLSRLINDGVQDAQEDVTIVPGINVKFFDTKENSSPKLKTAVRKYLQQQRLCILQEEALTIATQLIEANIKARDIFKAQKSSTEAAKRRKQNSSASHEGEVRQLALI